MSMTDSGSDADVLRGLESAVELSWSEDVVDGAGDDVMLSYVDVVDQFAAASSFSSWSLYLSMNAAMNGVTTAV